MQIFLGQCSWPPSFSTEKGVSGAQTLENHEFASEPDNFAQPSLHITREQPTNE